MTKKEELTIKLDRIRSMMLTLGIDGVYLKRQDNFAWLTCGGQNYLGWGEENITYEIVGDSDIYHGYSEQYVVKKFNNGVLVPEAEFTFSIIGDAPASAYTLVIDSDSKCTIIANDSVYSIILRATDNDTEEYIEKNITLRNLF